VLAESMGMQVVFYDVVKKLPLGNAKVMGSLAELLACSDFVTLHVPATPQTEMMIGKAEIAAMKSKSYLINASRGSVVELGALAEALREGHLVGAAVDVYPEEPEANGKGFVTPLQELPNVILTPHVGGSTEEAQEAIGNEVAASLIGFLREGVSAGAVNFPNVELPARTDVRRVLNIHHNRPGVLRQLTTLVADLGANILGQYLATDADIGYVVMDVKDADEDLLYARLREADFTIRTRVVY